MARKASPGISFYPLEVDHLTNSRLRLLFNEFNSDGYWIWSCLVAMCYKHKGYYFDVSDEEGLELFATDVCKKRVSLVKEVIEGCVRRGLFDKAVFDMFQLLTSDRIQSNYLEATSERRRKGTIITMISEILLIEPEESAKNLSIIGINDIFPGKKSIIPRNNSHSKEEEKENKKESKEEAPDAPAPDVDFLKNRKKSKEKKKDAPPVFQNPFSETFLPYWDLWKQFKKEQFGFSFKSSLSEQAAANDLAGLSKGDEATAILIIEQSIAKGWKGFFELKNNQVNGKIKHVVGKTIEFDTA